ncbi:MAG: hypothetical protein WJ289_05650 [Ferrovum myxofaciens]|uniref:hypothetical protein n=1 Tax=Ferrovum myxofaciens TaxID=416213 RepID=UPI003EBBF75B
MSINKILAVSAFSLVLAGCGGGSSTGIQTPGVASVQNALSQAVQSVQDQNIVALPATVQNALSQAVQSVQDQNIVALPATVQNALSQAVQSVQNPNTLVPEMRSYLGALTANSQAVAWSGNSVTRSVQGVAQGVAQGAEPSRVAIRGR